MNEDKKVVKRGLSKQEKFLSGWLVLAGLANIFSNVPKRELIDIVTGTFLTIVVWYILWSITFFTYNKVTKVSGVTKWKKILAWTLAVIMFFCVAQFAVGILYGTLRFGYFHQLPPLSTFIH